MRGRVNHPAYVRRIVDRRGRFERTIMSHPAIYMVEYALAQSLLTRGMMPDYVLSSSLGETAAAAVACVFSAEDGLRCVMKQATGVTGTTGATGATGATGSTAASAPASSSLFADSQTSSLSLSLTAETTIQTLNVTVVTGQRVKIDNSTQVAVVVGSNWSIAYNINLRVNGVLINQLQLSRTGNASGSISFLSSNTYVDTATATTTNVYTISISFVTTTSVTSSSAQVRNINAIVFT
ncbi:acyltransferase domain-containing protein [Paenibacillus sp. PAMC 26794]|uniref:acyltransferase domain-containing protein n=1 Tax=Paenibacillus sp. PAMC 26794 TaxID=1257080 RepID=UPI0003047FB3|nr:acyltransferase domain-containing protein [Paenibacillus sp. PAMC 26794]